MYVTFYVLILETKTEILFTDYLFVASFFTQFITLSSFLNFVYEGVKHPHVVILFHILHMSTFEV